MKQLKKHQRNTRGLIASVALSAAVMAGLAGYSDAQVAPPDVTVAPTTQPQVGVNSGITTQPNGQLMINFQDAQISTVLDELSAKAGFVIVKVIEPAGRISIISKQALPRDDAVRAFNSVLNERGYAAVQQGRTLKIVNKADAQYMNIRVITASDPKDIDPTDELVTCVVPLKYASAQQLRNDLLPLINPGATFTANQSSNALMITDTMANIQRIVTIVKQLDGNIVERSDVEVFNLKYANAADVARTINDLFRLQQQGGRGAGGGGAPQNIQGGGGRGAAQFGGGGGGGFGGGGGGGFGGGGGGGGRRGGRGG